jgi:hypothetical protein
MSSVDIVDSMGLNDTIDITDSNFSLSGLPVPNIETEFDRIIIGSNESSDYTLYIYIGLAIICIVATIFLYKYYYINPSKNYIQTRNHMPTQNPDPTHNYQNKSVTFA